MASGHGTAQTGRTHGCTDQACDVKILLANLEPSTHGTSRQSPQRINSDAIGGIADMPRSPGAHPGDANDPKQTRRAHNFEVGWFKSPFRLLRFTRQPLPAPAQNEPPRW
jgi:hypothetical protein